MLARLTYETRPRVRAGNAGSNTTADHLEVTDLALAQIPDDVRYGSPILIRADGAGATKPLPTSPVGGAVGVVDDAVREVLAGRVRYR